jgi:hypothetical protein
MGLEGLLTHMLGGGLAGTVGVMTAGQAAKALENRLARQRNENILRAALARAPAAQRYQQLRPSPQSYGTFGNLAMNAQPIAALPARAAAQKLYQE